MCYMKKTFPDMDWTLHLFLSNNKESSSMVSHLSWKKNNTQKILLVDESKLASDWHPNNLLQVITVFPFLSLWRAVLKALHEKRLIYGAMQKAV